MNVEAQVRQVRRRLEFWLRVPHVRPVGRHAGRTRHQSRRDPDQWRRRGNQSHDRTAGLWLNRHGGALFRGDPAE
jgi:hypothetical protein